MVYLSTDVFFPLWIWPYSPKRAIVEYYNDADRSTNLKFVQKMMRRLRWFSFGHEELWGRRQTTQRWCPGQVWWWLPQQELQGPVSSECENNTDNRILVPVVEISRIPRSVVQTRIRSFMEYVPSVKNNTLYRKVYENVSWHDDIVCDGIKHRKKTYENRKKRCDGWSVYFVCGFEANTSTELLHLCNLLKYIFDVPQATCRSRSTTSCRSMA